MDNSSDYREIRISKDELTGLLDKQTFYECAQDLIDSVGEEQEYAFVFFDLDNFKIFNVNYGYEIGDELLISIGYIIKDVFQGQLISRFSGDHFVVCANSVQIVPAIKSIRDRIKLVQKNVNVELKAGIYIYDGEETDVIRCCDRARMACISIKKKYDVEYKFYDEELGGSLKRKQEILDSLDEAIERKYIKVYYQPIVRTLTGEVCSWEALVRWIDPVKGMVFPNEFIPVLEEYRLIPKIDAFVIEEVLSKYHRDVEGKIHAVPVSINLSRIDFEVVDLVAYIDAQMEKYCCPKDMFHFEVTESALTENPQFIMDQIKKMRDKGYQVWMDDFGSGYSSLNLLKNYEFDLVKIDMDFLSHFDTTDNGKIILRHIVSMIKNLKVHTLAEGVETQEQYDFLKSIGCEMIQGYLIGRPMPYIQSLDSMKKDGRSLETGADRVFYEMLGKVDILRQNPLQNIENTDIENPLPLAIGVLNKDNHWKVLYTNSGFRRVMDTFNILDIEGVEEFLNEIALRDWEQNQRFIDICHYSKETNTIGSMDFIGNGRIINLRVRHICNEMEMGSDAFLVSVRLLSRLLSSSNDEKINAISRSMFSRFECVDLFGLDNNYFENIYLSDSRLHLDYEQNTPECVIKDIGEKMVHPDDRKYFYEMFDLATVRDRLAEENSGQLVGFYRILDSRKQYVWKSVTLSIMHMENFEALLSCVCEASHEIARRMTDWQNERIECSESVCHGRTKNDISPTVENILQLIPVGVFWKDKERRFLGANQMFLDYYGLQSVEGIIGKTDEDMGWHIDPEPFKKDELEVINDGKIIKDVQGECIVRGKVRKIAASKQPFIIDRKIVGLVGYFKDITDELEELEKLEKLTLTDSLTGLYNRRAFEELVQKYITRYEVDNSDFAILMLDIDRFKHINDMFGHDVGDEVLKKVGRVLSRVAAENSLAFRFGGDEFIILHQHKNMAELESIKEEIQIQLSRVDEVASTQIAIRVSVGITVYSEHENINTCIDEADKRMYSEKEKHQRGKI